MALPDGLLEDAKKYLEITWSDSDTDSKLSGMLSRGIIYLDRLAGKANDYTQESAARELLFTRVRYERAGALADFDNDYRSLIRAFEDDALVENEVVDYETTE